MSADRSFLKHGLFFEDFVLGETFESAGRTIYQSVFEGFTGLTGDFSDVHTDAEAMARTEFGAPIGHAILSLAVMQGLMWLTGYVRNTAAATLGWNDMKWITPLYAGETVTAVWTIEALRPSSSRPGMGIITESCQLNTSGGQTILTGQHVLMVRRRAD